MSKISIVFQRLKGAITQGVIPVSILLLAVGLLQGCGNKGDLYRESDAAALDSLQQAADKLRQRQDDTDPEKDDEKEEKPVKKNATESDQKTNEQAATGN